MSAELACIPPARIGELWPHVSHLIKRAMERGDGDFATTERHLLEGKAYLWAAIDNSAILAVAITQVDRDHHGRFLNLVACGGHDWERFAHLIHGIEDYARAEKCLAIEIVGRRGWARQLPDYRMKNITLRKELANG